MKHYARHVGDLSAKVGLCEGRGRLRESVGLIGGWGEAGLMKHPLTVPLTHRWPRTHTLTVQYYTLGRKFHFLKIESEVVIYKWPRASRLGK